ncbi:MAG: PepSY domain-containing protein [Pseudohongiellaceae bacterium]
MNAAVKRWLGLLWPGGISLAGAMVILLVLAALAGSGVVRAQPADGPETDTAILEAEEPGPVTRKQALDRVRHRFPGEVISISEVTDGERARYRVRLDNEGNVFTVYVDQATGRVSRE